MLCPEDGKECWSSGCFFQHGFNKICSKQTKTYATGGTMIMKEQDAAHSFDGFEGHTPGPWHYQEESDAYTHIIRGPNNECIVHGSQDTSGRVEKDMRLIVHAVNSLKEFTRLRSELQQERELRKELVEVVENYVDLGKLAWPERIESLIKKAKLIN